MNEENKNNEQQNQELPKNENQKLGFWGAVKKYSKKALKYGIVAGTAFGLGYVARKVVDKDIYEDAEAQRQWREKKQN